MGTNMLPVTTYVDDKEGIVGTSFMVSFQDIRGQKSAITRKESFGKELSYN